MNIGNTFLEVAESNANRTAFTYEGNTWTYEEIASIVHQWSIFFQNNITENDRVLIVSENRPEMVAVYLAVAGIGGIFVPVNPQLSDQELIDIFERTEPRCIITSDLTNKRMKALLIKSDINIKSIEDVIPTIYNFDHRFPDFNPHKGCLIAFSSGSTGKPKAIYASHKNEYTSAKQYGELWGMNNSDTILVTTPLSFLYGLTTGALNALFAGANISLHRRFHPREALEAMEVDKTTVFIGVPTMYTMMLDVQSKAEKRYNTDTLRLMLTAGAPISNSILDKFKNTFGIEPWNFYALSEIRPIFTYDVNQHKQIKRGSCGRRITGVDVKLIDDSGNEVTKPGIQGEVVAKSDTLMLRYYDDLKLTNSVIRDGWFYTGDLAEFDEEGNYFIRGRKKDFIIRGGVNISPVEIEDFLYTNPAILEVCVFGVEDKVYGEEIFAVVVLKENETLTEEQIRIEVKAGLAEYKVPKYIKFAEQLPKNNSGKIDKKRVKEQWESSVLQQPN